MTMAVQVVQIMRKSDVTATMSYPHSFLQNYKTYLSSSLISFGSRCGSRSLHSGLQPERDFRELLRVVVVSDRLNDGLRTMLPILAHEDARADKHRLCAQLHHYGGVCRVAM